MDHQARKLGEELNDVRDRLGETIGSIAEKTTMVRDRIDAGVTNVTNASANVTANVAERLPDPKTVREGLKNPVVLTVGLLAAGVLAGLVAPLSALERRTLGPIGSEVARRAADARDEVIDQSKAVLTETVTAARESAERHGQDLATNLGVGASSAGSTAG